MARHLLPGATLLHPRIRAEYGPSAMLAIVHGVECDGVVAAIIEASRSRRFVPSHLLCDLELSTVLQVGRDASRAKTVRADLRPDAGWSGE